MLQSVVKAEELARMIVEEEKTVLVEKIALKTDRDIISTEKEL